MGEDCRDVAESIEALHEAAHAVACVKLLGVEAMRKVRLGDRPACGGMEAASDPDLEAAVAAAPPPQDPPGPALKSAKSRLLINMAGVYGEQLSRPPSFFVKIFWPSGDDLANAKLLAWFLGGGDDQRYRMILAQAHPEVREFIEIHQDWVRRVADSLMERRQLDGGAVASLESIEQSIGEM
jgi:hypothetical protein